MAVIQLSDTWEIKDYAKVFEAATKEQEPLESPFLNSLEHRSLPGLKWRLKFSPRGNRFTAKPNYTALCVHCVFGVSKGDATSASAAWTVRLIGDGNRDISRVTSFGRQEHFPRFGVGTQEVFDSYAFHDSFPQFALKRAVQTSGSVFFKLDLTIFKLSDLLKCDTLRLLLADVSHVDFVFKVGHVTFPVHRAVLARQSREFAAIFEKSLVASGQVGDGNNTPKEFIVEDTTPEAFGAFRDALYFKNFHFLSDWKLSLDLLKLAHKFKVVDLSRYCDDALSEMSLATKFVLQILPDAFRCEALRTQDACVSRLDADKKSWALSLDWAAFKVQNADVGVSILEAFMRKSAGDVTPPRPKFLAPEIAFSKTWSVPAFALVPNSSAVRSSPTIVCHKTFPGVHWRLEFHPRGNAQDPQLKPGFASLYLKAEFGTSSGDLKAVYAKWKATIVDKDGVQRFAPAAPEFLVYSGVTEAKFGAANAFQIDHVTAAAAVDNKGSLAIRLDLTVASIPEILKRRELIASLSANTEFADVEIDVDGTIFKAHRCVLAVRSDVFAKMFDTDMRESATGRVDVDDATPAAFEHFLAGVYYSSWNFLTDKDATLDVLKLAEKYAVLDLKEYCDEALAAFVTRANLFEILPKAATHNASATKAACVEILCANEQMMKSNEWIQFKKAISKEMMADILEALAERFRADRKRKHDDDR